MPGLSRTHRATLAAMQAVRGPATGDAGAQEAPRPAPRPVTVQFLPAPFDPAALHVQERDSFPIWSIYRFPADHPNHYVARMFRLRPVQCPTDFKIIGKTLADVRRNLPPGLACFARDAHDVPWLVETWM